MWLIIDYKQPLKGDILKIGILFFLYSHLQLISFSLLAVIALFNSCSMELEPSRWGCVFPHILLNLNPSGHGRAHMQTQTANRLQSNQICTDYFCWASLLQGLSGVFNYTLKCAYISTVVDENTVCAFLHVRRDAPQSFLSFPWRDTVTAGGQEMKLSWRSSRPSWPRMHCSPRLMSGEHRKPSQDSSLDIVSAKLFQQEYWLELTIAAPSHLLTPQKSACVNSPLDDSLPPHANIILQNILLPDLSKVPLNTDWTLYLFSHITKYISGGVEYHTFKESWMELCFCFSQSADFSHLGTYSSI